MTPEAVDRIRRFVAHEAETPFEEILPGTRLYSDLNIDGPRAVVFMERFSAKFKVDIEDLWVHWDEYFSTEGVTVKGVLTSIIAGAIAYLGIYFAFPHLAMHFAILISIGIMLAVALIFMRGGSSDKERKEITVGELVSAVQSERLRLR